MFRFRDTTFADNSAGETGGGIRVSGYATFTNCIFERNQAMELGGGILALGSSLHLVYLDLNQCEFRDNVATAGGAMHLVLSHASLSDLHFCGNSEDDIFGEYIDYGENEFLDACEHLCPSDINGDGAVDISDLLGLLGAWGSCPAAPGCSGDVNYDGSIDATDLLLLITNWGQCP